MFLALKTNLMRDGMSEREQGKVLHQISQEHNISQNISQNELAKKLGKDDMWVRRRIKLALDLCEKVADAL